MLKLSDIKHLIDEEFEPLLSKYEFERVDKLKWVRTQKKPITEIFALSRLKGSQFSPVWGFSSGMAPLWNRRKFVRHSTGKDAVMDLVLDPIDITGDVPKKVFGLPFDEAVGWEKPLTRQIRKCAKHFIPLAMKDFHRVNTIPDFCDFFIERSRLEYRRFTFEMYSQQCLFMGFVRILKGQRDEGLQLIKEFCDSVKVQERVKVEYADEILAEYIQKAESYQAERA